MRAKGAEGSLFVLPGGRVFCAAPGAGARESYTISAYCDGGRGSGMILLLDQKNQ